MQWLEAGNLVLEFQIVLGLFLHVLTDLNQLTRCLLQGLTDLCIAFSAGRRRYLCIASLHKCLDLTLRLNHEVRHRVQLGRKICLHLLYLTLQYTDKFSLQALVRRALAQPALVIHYVDQLALKIELLAPNHLLDL